MSDCLLLGDVRACLEVLAEQPGQVEVMPGVCFSQGCCCGPVKMHGKLCCYAVATWVCSSGKESFQKTVFESWLQMAVMAVEPVLFAARL
jgi:hypothetical protein